MTTAYGEHTKETSRRLYRKKTQKIRWISDS